MRRRALVVSAVVALLSMSGACGNAPAGSSASGNRDGVFPDRVVVGSLASQTGPLPAGFAPVITGAQAYFDMVNAAGGVAGRRIDLAYKLDDQSSPSVDTTQARALVDQYHVFAVVGVATPSFSGAGYLASHNVPTFGLDVNPNSAWLAGPTMYGHNGSFVDFGAPQLQSVFLAQQHGVHAAAVIAYNVAQSQQGCEGVTTGFRRYGIPVVFEDTAVPAPASDLHADVNRMKQAGADMVVSCLDLSGNILLSQTMQQTGLTGLVQLWLDGYDESAVGEFASAMEGAYFFEPHVPFEVTALSPGTYPGMDRVQQMLARYARGTQPSVPALAGWTSADLFVTGLRAVGRDLTRSRLVAALNRLPSFTADGILAPVDWRIAHTRTAGPLNCSSFVQVRGGRFVPVYGTSPSVFSCFPSPAPASGPVQPIVPLPAGVPPT